MNVGIIGCGVIATWLSETFVKIDSNIVIPYAIASESFEASKKLAQMYGWKKCYETYEELMQDPEVNIICVTVDYPFHYEVCKKALEYNKNVICEKPFCVNEKQAKEIFDLAEKKQLFITEALWTNYMPSNGLIDEVISSGVVGEIVKAEIIMNSNVSFLERIKLPEMAGGAVMDVGSYTFSRMTTHFGYSIKSIKAKFQYFDTGVDESEVIYVKYENGLQVRIENSVNAEIECDNSTFYGAKGKIVVEGTANPKSIKVYDLKGDIIKVVAIPTQISGYEYEFLASARALENNELECKEIPHAQSIFILSLMDKIRKMGNIHFPFE